MSSYPFPALFLAIGIFNLLAPPHPAPDYTATPAATPETEAAKAVIGAKCIMCHSKNPALPFYAKIIGAEIFIQKHVQEGTGMMNLQELLAGTSTDKWAYDRLEHTITSQKMPIASYLTLHWNGKLTQPEQKTLLEWIEQRRTKSK